MQEFKTTILSFSCMQTKKWWRDYDLKWSILFEHRKCCSTWKAWRNKYKWFQYFACGITRHHPLCYFGVGTKRKEEWSARTNMKLIIIKYPFHLFGLLLFILHIVNFRGFIKNCLRKELLQITRVKKTELAQRWK